MVLFHPFLPLGTNLYNLSFPHIGEELFGKKRGIELFARDKPTCSDNWDCWGVPWKVPVKRGTTKTGLTR